MSESNKRNFIVHGSILAIAGILVRIIGMLYRIPVVNIIGSEGNGIYGAAFNIYNIMLVLSSYGLPMAVSKLVSARFTKRRYKSAAKVLRCSLMVAVCTGGIAALLVFFGASFIENVIWRRTSGTCDSIKNSCTDNIPCCNSWSYKRLLSGTEHNDSNCGIADT